jgi:hypothetical protein
MWAWGCVDVLVHHTCTARGHLGMGTWTSLVYVVITRVSGHGSSRVFTTRRVCHTSTCTARGHPSMCTWTALAYVVTAHHVCSPLVGYAIRVHVRHVDTRVCVRGQHLRTWSRHTMRVHHSSGMPYEYMYGTWTPEYVYTIGTWSTRCTWRCAGAGLRERHGTPRMRG